MSVTRFDPVASVPSSVSVSNCASVVWNQVVMVTEVSTVKLCAVDHSPYVFEPVVSTVRTRHQYVIPFESGAEGV